MGFLSGPDPVKESLLKEVRNLSKQLAEVEGQAEAMKLREEINKLKIDKERKLEEFEKRDREITHKIGLERTRQEQEAELAKREAIQEVREENLDADKERFAKEVEFRTKRFEEEIGYLKEIMQGIMKRMPQEKVVRKITEKSE